MQHDIIGTLEASIAEIVGASHGTLEKVEPTL